MEGLLRVDPMIDRRCSILEAAWAWWARTLAPLDGDAWNGPTRLPGWRVHDLVAHHAMFVQALAYLAIRPLDHVGTPPPTAASMLRRFNEPGGAAREHADLIAEVARSHAAATALVQRFGVEGPAALDAVRATGPVVVEYLGNGPFPLTEVLAIGILEAVAHGLDLARALGARPDLPPDGLAFTTALLAEVADPVTFVEAATGRTTETVLPVLR
jgi:uncharacterized protein (TIGR03083 family)